MVNTKRDFEIGDFGENAVRQFYQDKQIPIHTQHKATPNLNKPAFAQSHKKHETDIIVVQKTGMYFAEVKTKTALWNNKEFPIDKSEWDKMEHYLATFKIDTLIWICYKPENGKAYLYCQWFSKLKQGSIKEITIKQNEGFVKDTRVKKVEKKLVLTAATEYLPVRKIEKDLTLKQINISHTLIQDSTSLLFKPKFHKKSC